MNRIGSLFALAIFVLFDISVQLNVLVALPEALQGFWLYAIIAGGGQLAVAVFCFMRAAKTASPGVLKWLGTAFMLGGLAAPAIWLLHQLGEFAQHCC